MSFLLIIIYTALFTLVISRARFFYNERLPRYFILFVFLLKALAGIAYTAAFKDGDTGKYFYDADAIIFPTLLKNPLQYFYLTFGPNGGEIPQFIKPAVQAMGYWGDTSAYMVVRFNALARIFSFGNFYVHAVFMAFLSLIGLVWLYKACMKTFGTTRFTAPAIFLIPSAVFWGSGVHKEGLLLFSLGLFFYGSVQLSRVCNMKNILLFAAGAFFTFLIRDFIFLLLIPGIPAFFISAHDSGKAKWIFPLSYLLFFCIGCLFPIFNGNNFLEIIAYKQNQFLAINAGNTQIDISRFEATFSSLFLHLPEALKNSAASPFLITPDSLSHLAVMAENAMLFVILLLAAFSNGKPKFTALTLWFLIFSIALLILIGYIVPNVGAIVRYRSLTFPFFFIALLSGKTASWRQ